MRLGGAWRNKRKTRRFRPWQSNAAIGSTLIAVAVPKCPLCLIGVASAIGLGTLVDSAWLRPLTLAFLGTAVLMLTLTAYRRRSYAPVFLGAMAATLVFSGKFHHGGDWLTYLGIVMLVAASLWSGRARFNPAAEPECGCEAEPEVSELSRPGSAHGTPAGG